MDEYNRFVRHKAQLDGEFGFEPSYMPDDLFDFQRHAVEWSIRKGRAGIFADCGLGKTFMQLVWSQNVYAKTGKPILILTPLAVANQTKNEAYKFNIEASRSIAGEIESPIVITNYERLHHFNSDDFGGVVCDESSILKSFDGTRRKQITEFMRIHKYRLLGTATAAPNNFTELGTSSEALGYLGYMDMLGRFFTNRKRTSHQMKGRWRDSDDGYRFKGHADQDFWRWVSSWARAFRKPSDLGYDDSRFLLPDLTVENHIVKASTAPPGMLFDLPAIGWQEEKADRRRTINERCERVAELVNDTGQSAIVWCGLNPEGDLLDKLIPDAMQVAGKHSDEQKEERFEAFTNGDLRVLITKAKIGAWGLNWQHCNHVVYFPSHSYEQYYQAVRRVWRFGQERPVKVDIVATRGEELVMKNLQKKAGAAGQMFSELVAHMNQAVKIDRLFAYNKKVEVPTWL